jgi:hypothetical protein
VTDTTTHIPPKPEDEPPVIPPVQSPRPINAGHVIATGGTTAMLAGVLQWISAWPLKPLDAGTAADLAGLLITAVTAVITVLRSSKQN